MNANDILMGGGGTKGGFTRDDPTGTTVKGVVVSVTSQQQTDFATKEPKKYANGDPMMQIKVVLATDLREGEDDNGERAVYLKGLSRDSEEANAKSSLSAVRDAIREAGGSGLEIGATLAIKFVKLGKATRGNAPKLYSARYKLPDALAVAAAAEKTVEAAKSDEDDDLDI